MIKYCIIFSSVYSLVFAGNLVATGIEPKPAPAANPGSRIPKGVQSEAIADDHIDAKAVRIILDSNELTNVKVSDVAVVEGGRVVGLYLQELGVEEIPDYPPTLTLLDQLKTLHLYGNRDLHLPLLKKLPYKINECVHLEELLVQHNDLGTLPPTFAQVPNLKTLSLADNHLSNLPPAIAEYATRLDPQGMTQQNGPATPDTSSDTLIVPRFEITDRDWPTQVGAASVCLWKDDALACFSQTVDDNCGPDQEWWLEMGRKYGIRVTWVIITGMVSDRSDLKPSNWYWGTWEGFRNLFAAGHDVQSHSFMHENVASPKWAGMEAEYSESQKDIEKNIPGDRCLIFAYPDGAATEGQVRLAKKYYIGARGGGQGYGLIRVNALNYYRTRGMGNLINFELIDQPGLCMAPILEKKPSELAMFYRGWYGNTCHDVPIEYKGKPFRAELEKEFEIIQKKVAANELWMALFREVCQYGQERDTAKVETVKATKDQVVLKLTNALMDDPRFDFPLTVKVRLDPHWKSIVATQAAKPVEAKIVEHSGDNYALVQVVPGRGEVTLSDK